MMIEKTLSKMYPGISKLVIELVVDYALRCARAEISAESLEDIKDRCNVTIKPDRLVSNIGESELDYEIRCCNNDRLSNDCAAAGMLCYAQKTGGIPTEFSVDDIWLNALTAARDLLTASV